ncbi:hypothetical protein N825_10305 [Skermanella stibiiresistens SB22]|uniref:Uncharacterized protein n=1 Tax=Skermanella stibiiresistens SB22 TaxID=1385369 RepID=W9H530_9PROT|nr:hypothetical protein N825_10305 [Skermanella stibiiresistens SB22]
MVWVARARNELVARARGAASRACRNEDRSMVSAILPPLASATGLSVRSISRICKLAGQRGVSERGNGGRDRT